MLSGGDALRARVLTETSDHCSDKCPRLARVLVDFAGRVDNEEVNPDDGT